MQNSPARPSIDVGSVIAGTYTIEALIGRGGMGAVFLASHTRLPGKKVAIKVLHDDLGSDEIQRRFKREANIAALLSHPNIVHIEDYNVTAEGMPYLVLEYLQGESLAQRLSKGPMSVDAVFPIIRQVGSALAAAHGKGIVHRDLKPQNIFLVPSTIDGRTMEIAKVLDFGISKMRDSSTLKTQESALLGTPQYMAPEQALGKHEEVDERSDVFALGSIVYEMFAGQAPFSGQTIPEVVFKVVYEPQVPLETRVPALSGQVTSAVARALAKKPDDRFPTVTAFIEGLTGSPVSIIRNPPVGVYNPNDTATASVTPPGFDAFAQTLGSGDHGTSPLTRTPTPALPIIDGDAATVASQDGHAPAPILVAPATSKRTGLVLGGVLLAAAAAAAVMYGVMRTPTPPPPQPPDVVAAVVPPAPIVTPAATPDAPPVEHELLVAPTGSGSGSAAVVKPVVVDKKPPKHVAESADDKPAIDDTHAGQKLGEAFTAINDKRWQAARTAASLVITAEDALPKHRLQAQIALAIAACHLNDEEAAASALRKIPLRNPLMRSRILTECHRVGYLEALQR